VTTPVAVAPAPVRPMADDPKNWPPLTRAQIERIAAHGRARRVERGEVLIELGKKIPLFFVVKSGTI
jgi:CRP-like cAMP-binding protein